MAEAYKRTNTVTTTTYHLDLSEEEASALLRVLANVGGSPVETRRGLTDNIYNSLIKLEVSGGANDTSGTLYFRDTLQ